MFILESMRFARARIMCQRQPNDVYLIVRFDENDNSLKAYISQPNVVVPEPSVYPVMMAKQDIPAWGHGEVVQYHPLPLQGGGHAEVMFLRYLPTLIQNYGQQPGKIEMYLSRIPCASNSPMMRLTRPGALSPETLPVGCGPKLEIVMGNWYPHVAWRLMWAEDYPSLQTQTRSLANINQLNQLPNVKAAHVSQAYTRQLDV